MAHEPMHDDGRLVLRQCGTFTPPVTPVPDFSPYGVLCFHEEIPDHPPWYTILPFESPLEAVCDGMTLTLPQTPENDADVQAIVDALSRIATRLRQENRTAGWIELPESIVPDS